MSSAETTGKLVFTQLTSGHLLELNKN
jgi:hypothetical protein